MKKSILMLGLAVAAITSCTNDEVLEQAQPVQKAIGFESFVNKGTRAVTETTTAEITKFKAFGYYANGVVANNEVLWANGVDVTKSDNVWGYDEDQTRYWTSNIYRFAGIADSNTEGFSGIASFAPDATNPNAATLTISNYTVDNAKDLVADVVTVSNTTLSNSIVGFTFEHLLSQINFTIQNTDPNGYKMKIISPLVISSVHNTGNCTVIEDGSKDTGIDWTFTGAANSTLNPSNGAVSTNYIASNNGTSGDAVSYFVIPQELASVQFTITVHFFDNNNQKVYEKTLNGTISRSNVTKWVPGNIYNYTISLPAAATPIEFGNISVNGEWTTTGCELNNN